MVFYQQHGGLTLYARGLHRGLKHRLQLGESEAPRDGGGEQGAPLHVCRQDLMVQQKHAQINTQTR